MNKDLPADIRARLSVEDVVGHYLDLKKSGSSYKALSPFKTEKTPSLIVTPAKGIWKDFSSGKGGNIFNFVMEYEGVDFKQALEILANRAGLNLADYSYSKRQARSKNNLRPLLLRVLELTTEFYQEQLSQAKVAQVYLNQRGFKKEIIQEFGLGYAPQSWQALSQHLKAKKVPVKYAEAAGVIKKRQLPAWQTSSRQSQSKEYGDFFGDRLMIPLSDPQGATIGFTARLLKDKEGVAKYINSKQSLLYNKSKHVFGYFQAKNAIRQKGFVLVVEGNLDVIACHQAGYQQTLAAGGTALTVDHLKIIGRLTDDVRLAFDGDAAGIAAMERSLQAAGQAKVNLSIISLPDNLDPDDLIKQNLKLWQKLVAKPQAAPDWLYHKHKSQLNLKTALGKKRLTDVMLPIINSLPDEVVQDHYLKKLEADGISRQSLERKLKKVKQTEVQVSQQLPQATEVVETNRQLNKIVYNIEDRLNLLIGLMLTEPKLRIQPAQINQRLQSILKEYPKHYQVYNFLKESPNAFLDLQNLPKSLQESKQYVRLALKTLQNQDGGGFCFDDTFAIKQKTFQGLFYQLDIAQRKKERSHLN